MNSASLTIRSKAYLFSWELEADCARVTRGDTGDEVWRGSLLPLFWLSRGASPLEAVKARARLPVPGVEASGATALSLELGDLGVAVLTLRADNDALRFEQLQVSWRTSEPPRIHSLYFGADILTPDQRAAVPTCDLPFWPSWRAEGFAVASAKTSPMQSFFRSWDFGHANLPLGSFGPAMGTPYAAAFPRPTYAACAGGRHGWICAGAGSVPDAALTFQVRARSGALEWRSREDLWGAPSGLRRTWENPLWITCAPTAWEAYRDYFRLFREPKPKPATHQKSFWGTWGNFRLNCFDLRASIDRAVDEMEANLICIDDPWESRKGSCRPHPGRLPTFDADIAYAHERKLGVGIWMPTGWIEDYAAEGLTVDDLLLSRDGVPVRSNWAIDPHEAGQAFYCLDPSTPGTKRFLRERTLRIMREYRPTLLKIDFGYGLPGPDACAARDPALRGERIAWSYAKLIADAAREVDDSVTILGYSLHPLWADAQDQISLDDLGDAGSHEAAGHGQWSIWAALAADRGAALMGSSGYIWEADTDVLLNSAILGAPGANLPHTRFEGAVGSSAQLTRRRALFRWHRRTTRWEPLWLDSAVGSIEEEPAPRSWGRLEPLHGETRLTALALREPSLRALGTPELRGLSWTGRWILIAQDDESIFDSKRVALIPFGAATLSLPRARSARSVCRILADRRREAANWHWCQGRLEIVVDETIPAGADLGYLVES